mgnify:CR=1 FL=1
MVHTYEEVKKACQRAVEEAWNKTNNKGQFFFAGFCFVRFKGLKNKNKLEKLGFDVNKGSEVGFYINAEDLFEMPDYIRNSGDNDIKAMWHQSLALKEGIDCWVDSIID